MIYLQLFLSYLQIGLFSIGGGYAAMPLIEHQVVEVHPWLTETQFADIVTIAEMTPGPIAVNSATFVGTLVAGLRPAVVAMIASAGITLFLTAVYGSSALSAGTAALTDPDVRALVIFLGAFLILRIRKTNPIRVMVGSGVAGLILFSLF